jgi:hypothetical protein
MMTLQIGMPDPAQQVLCARPPRCSTMVLNYLAGGVDFSISSRLVLLDVAQQLERGYRASAQFDS